MVVRKWKDRITHTSVYREDDESTLFSFQLRQRGRRCRLTVESNAEMVGDWSNIRLLSQVEKENYKASISLWFGRRFGKSLSVKAKVEGVIFISRTRIIGSDTSLCHDTKWYVSWETLHRAMTELTMHYDTLPASTYQPLLILPVTRS